MCSSPLRQGQDLIAARAWGWDIEASTIPLAECCRCQWRLSLYSPFRALEVPQIIFVGISVLLPNNAVPEDLDAGTSYPLIYAPMFYLLSSVHFDGTQQSEYRG